MQPPLRDMVVIVTGSTQGIGEAVARAAIAGGAAGVLVTGRNRARGEAVVESLPPGRAVFEAAELAESSAPGRIVARCMEAFGRVDGLVNAAASTARAGLLEADAAFIDTMFAANVRAPMLLMQGVVRHMREARRGGAIVNILSVNAYCGQPDLAVYSASKGALATLTRNAANAFRSERIRVNGIMLGWAETPAEHAVQARTSPHGSEWLTHATRSRPWGRLIQPAEVASLAAFLLGAESGVMTGALIDYEQGVLGGAPQ